MPSRSIPVTLAATLLFAFACGTSQAADDGASDHGEARVDSERVTLPANSPQLKNLRIVPVEAATSDSVRIPGRVVWNEDATVRVFSPFAGRVAQVRSDIGRVVHAGDTLALISAPDFGQAQADAHRAQTDLTLAERAAARAADLFQHGVVARKDLESADADVARARAEAQRAQARLAQYGGDASSIDQTFALRAPIGGTIVDRSISTGQEVRPDQMLANAPQLFAPLFIVTDPRRLWILLDVPERDLAAVRPGTTIRIRTEALGDHAFEGSITLVSSGVDPNTRTVKARASVPNPMGLLKDEMMVSVQLPRVGVSPVQVPVSAVLLEGNTHVVFVAEGPGKLRRQVVDAGREHDGFIPIRRGLSSSDRVVADGALFVEQLFHR